MNFGIACQDDSVAVAKSVTHLHAYGFTQMRRVRISDIMHSAHAVSVCSLSIPDAVDLIVVVELLQRHLQTLQMVQVSTASPSYSICVDG